jgi:hypothetical protein
MARCSHRGCFEEGPYRPVFMLAFVGELIAYRVCPDIPVCPGHRRHIRRILDSGSGRAAFVKAVSRRGNIDWNRSRIYFELRE